MPYKQNQDRADDCGQQSANDAKHLDIQQTLKPPAHKGPGYADDRYDRIQSPFLRSIRRLLRSTASKRTPPLDDREILARLPSHSPPSSAFSFGRLAVRLLPCPCL